MRRWWLELRYPDGRVTYPIAAMPGSWFIENWREVESVIQTQRGKPTFTLRSSDEDHILWPEMDARERPSLLLGWRVSPGDWRRADLRSAFAVVDNPPDEPDLL